MFVIPLQYLKKEVRNEVYFLYADIKHQSFYKLALLFLMEVARYVQSTCLDMSRHVQMKLIIFFQYITKKVLLHSIVMQNIQIFYGGPVMFVLHVSN